MDVRAPFRLVGVRTASTMTAVGMGASSATRPTGQLYRHELHSGPCPGTWTVRSATAAWPCSVSSGSPSTPTGRAGRREVGPDELACNPAGTVHGGVYGVVHDAATSRRMRRSNPATGPPRWSSSTRRCERRRQATRSRCEAGCAARRVGRVPWDSDPRRRGRTGLDGNGRVLRASQGGSPAQGGGVMTQAAVVGCGIMGSGITFVAAPPGSP